MSPSIVMDSLCISVTDPGDFFQFLRFLLYIMSGKLQESFLPFPCHHTGKFLILFQKLRRIKRNFRAACPEGNARKNFCKITHQLLHKGNVPDITGNTHHIRLFQIDISKDVIFLLIDSVFFKDHIGCVFLRICFQIIDCKIGMYIFGIKCR